MFPQLHSMLDLNGHGTRAGKRTTALLLALVVLVLPRTSAAQHNPPSGRVVAAFAERARSEKYEGNSIAVPAAIFQELISQAPPDYPFCRPVDQSLLQADQMPVGSDSQAILLAIQGASLCFCSATGNCEFWVFAEKKGKYDPLLKTDGVQVFGFLKSRTHGYPDLVTWSHESATWQDGRLFRFNGKRYLASGWWEEKYEYLTNDHGDVVGTSELHIISHFVDKNQIPAEMKRPGPGKR